VPNRLTVIRPDGTWWLTAAPPPCPNGFPPSAPFAFGFPSPPPPPPLSTRAHRAPRPHVPWKAPAQKSLNRLLPFWPGFLLKLAASRSAWASTAFPAPGPLLDVGRGIFQTRRPANFRPSALETPAAAAGPSLGFATALPTGQSADLPALVWVPAPLGSFPSALSLQMRHGPEELRLTAIRPAEKIDVGLLARRPPVSHRVASFAREVKCRQSHRAEQLEEFFAGRPPWSVRYILFCPRGPEDLLFSTWGPGNGPVPCLEGHFFRLLPWLFCRRGPPNPPPFN